MQHAACRLCVCILLFVARLLLRRSTTVIFLRLHATKKMFRLSFAQKSGGSQLQKSEEILENIRDL